MRFIGVNGFVNLDGSLPAQELHKSEQTVAAPGNADLLIGFMYGNLIQYANQACPPSHLSEGGRLACPGGKKIGDAQ
jgi:hypothetical protein